MPQRVHIGDDGSRMRKAHKKSRRGCRNCKLRRVKCDEKKPECEKCTTFGVSCNYDVNAPDLQLTHDGMVSTKWAIGIPSSRFKTFGPVIAPPSPYPTIDPLPINSLRNLEPEVSARLVRFGTRTILSVGTLSTSHIYQAAIPKLVFEVVLSLPDPIIPCTDLRQHPYLLNVVQTMTLMHDRFLSPVPSPKHAPLEFHHWSLAASQFNAALSNLNISDPLSGSDRDALWATAALLGTVAFCSIEASTPFEAWPLAPPNPLDLDWLRMSSGKASIWQLTDPLRPDSVFAPLKEVTEKMYLSALKPPTMGIKNLPPAFSALCDLDEFSTAENNFYFETVQNLAPLLSVDCDRNNIVQFLSFVAHMSPKFYPLLEAKDPRAMLLLSFWLAKILRAVWWVERRALLECQSICIYLQRFYAHEKRIMDLLRWPRMRCGLLEVGMKERVEVELEWTRILA